MKIDYNDRKFRPVSNSENSEISADMIFHYQQDGYILKCAYRGNNIKEGHLIGIVDQEGCIDMRYHQVNGSGHLMTGVCKSTPEFMANGKIRLLEEWQWTSGDKSKGKSILEEL